MSDDAAADDTRDAEGVHRLIDMLVEEVSLVDRAANQRRFLLVKRGDAMADEVEGGSAVAGGAAFGSALVAVLSGLVEVMSASEAEKAAPRKPPPDGAEGDDEGDDDEPPEGDGEDDGKGPPRPKKKSSRVEELLGEVKAALGRLAAAVTSPAQKAAPAAPSDAVVSKLDQIGTQLAGLDARMKTQDTRLDAVEKGVGVPASRTVEGTVRSTTDDEDVSWPLDLNQRMDRESTNKAVSFHDA